MHRIPLSRWSAIVNPGAQPKAEPTPGGRQEQRHPEVACLAGKAKTAPVATVCLRAYNRLLENPIVKAASQYTVSEKAKAFREGHAELDRCLGFQFLAPFSLESSKCPASKSRSIHCSNFRGHVEVDLCLGLPSKATAAKVRWSSEVQARVVVRSRSFLEAFGHQKRRACSTGPKAGL